MVMPNSLSTYHILFTGQTSQEMFPGHTHLHRPHCSKYEVEVTYMDEDGNIDAMDEKNQDVVLFMSQEYQDKNGQSLGATFFEEYTQKFEEDGEKMILSVLEGPIHCDPAIMVRQIVG